MENELFVPVNTPVYVGPYKCDGYGVTHSYGFVLDEKAEAHVLAHHCGPSFSSNADSAEEAHLRTFG